MRFSNSQPVLHYTLHVNPPDTTGIDIEIAIRNAPDSFRLGMMAHPEYDDRYSRYVERVRVETPDGAGTVTRLDSALWLVRAPSREPSRGFSRGPLVVRYHMRLPPIPGQRPAWVPFLTSRGALVGGPHTFMYVVGSELAPMHVTLDVPTSWDVATGLQATSDSRTFFAPTADILTDSPILMGQLRNWRFSVGGVPHRIAYWPLPDATPFDTAMLVSNIRRLSEQAIALFGRAPYREYIFLLQDGAYGALEHLNSVTLGTPSASLAEGWELMEEIAHEYFHTWNIMRIRPAEYGGISYRTPPRSSGLWWSEGITMLYADLLLRRAGVSVSDSTRLAHVQSVIGSYTSNSGNATFSPELSSRLAYGGTPLQFGDHAPSVHVQGEVLGTMLDLIIRDATNGRRTLDDVMPVMLQRFSGERGFTGAGIEQVVTEACGCAVHAFFEQFVRAPNAVDVNRYLALVGLRSVTKMVPATTSDGRPSPDLMVSAWQPAGALHPLARVFDARSAWAKAGIHTGDSVAAVNGTAVGTPQAFRSLVGRLSVGDTVRVDMISRTGAGPRRVTLVLPQRVLPEVTITEIPGATEKQRRLREAWLNNK